MHPNLHPDERETPVAPSVSRISRMLPGSRRKTLPIAAVIVAVIAVVSWYFASGPGATSAESDGVAIPQFELSADEVATAKSQLAQLEIAPADSMDGYTGHREDLFGTAWTDKAENVAMAGNGCDTRNDILARDLSNVKLDDDCTVLSGTLWDPYTGTTIEFTRGVGTSSDVQIDHIVALGNVWISGGQDMTQEQRVSIANDPRNLVAVDGPTNGAKGSQSADEWMPPNTGIACFYAASQINVKAIHHLHITQAEHDALAKYIAQCPAGV